MRARVRPPRPAYLLLMVFTGWLVSTGIPEPAAAQELTGNVSFESLWFPASPAIPVQGSHGVSFAFEPELYVSWAESRHTFTAAPFVRIDSVDSARTHVDIRELYWQMVGDTWELSAGFRKVFWGVAESRHLVDIINQTDLVEDLEREERLGQQMVQLTLIRDWGNLEFFLLPGFRERTFPGRDGRLRGSLWVDTEQPVYESASGRHHLDWAVRWSHSWAIWDVGLAHFAGTGRDPRLLLGDGGSGETVLVPFYEQIRQTSLDLQATTGAYLWKLETFHRKDSIEGFGSFVGGAEYTFTNVRNSGVDVGVLSEFLYDSRGARALTPFDNDLFVGTRLALNDTQSTVLLAGATFDVTSGAAFANFEASRRLGERWTLAFKARAFSHVPEHDVLYSLRQDHHFKIEIARFF